MTTTGARPDRGEATPPGARPAVRVVVADDHPVFRYGLLAVLEGADGIEAVGEAEDGAQLLEVVERERPDVVVTDLHMPGLDGVAATREVLARAPGTGVLVLTLHDDDATVTAALRAGALGYLVKGADRGEIVRAVEAVPAGQAVYGPSVGRRIVGFYTGVQERYSAQVFPQLTAREREVLDLVAAGCGNHAVAARLHLTEKTVRNHVSALLFKVGVPDRGALLVAAREAGLGRA